MGSKMECVHENITHPDPGELQFEICGMFLKPACSADPQKPRLISPASGFFFGESRVKRAMEIKFEFH
jgi:hypothetical protein